MSIPSKGKLVAYSASAVSFLLVTSRAIGQTIYQDYIPDYLLENPSNGVNQYELDLDGDGQLDFRFSLAQIWDTYSGTWGGMKKHISPLYGNKLLSIPRDFGASPLVFGPYTHSFKGRYIGPHIDGSTSWNSEKGLLHLERATGSGSVTSLGSSGFIGIFFQLSSGGVFRYGWMRLRVTDSIYVRDYFVGPPSAPVAAFLRAFITHEDGSGDDDAMR